MAGVKHNSVDSAASIIQGIAVIRDNHGTRKKDRTL